MGCLLQAGSLHHPCATRRQVGPGLATGSAPASTPGMAGGDQHSQLSRFSVFAQHAELGEDLPFCQAGTS